MSAVGSPLASAWHQEKTRYLQLLKSSFKQVGSSDQRQAGYSEVDFIGN